MSEANGEGVTRLDRIEQMIERQVIANEAAHDRFMEQHKLLQAAQTVMSDHLNKLDLKLAEITGKLNALIQVVDDLVRRRPDRLDT